MCIDDDGDGGGDGNIDGVGGGIQCVIVLRMQ